MNSVLTFANEYREAIEADEKTVTFRHSADPHPVGSTLVLLDEDGDLIGEATVALRQHVPLCDIVENREYAGHETYESVDEAVSKLSDYYPDKQISASTWIDVIGWGDLDTEPDPQLRADGGSNVRPSGGVAQCDGCGSDGVELDVVDGKPVPEGESVYKCPKEMSECSVIVFGDGKMPGMGL